MKYDNAIESGAQSRLLSPDNKLFELAQSGHLRLPQSWLENRPVLIGKILYPLIVIVFAYFIPQLAVVLGLPLVIPGFNATESRPDLGFALILIGSFLPIFVLVWLWLWVAEQRSLWTTGMIPPVIRPYLRGLGIGLLLFGSAVILLALLGFLDLENSGQGQGLLLTLGGTLLVLLGWIVQGAAEEVLARGFLLPILGTRWGPVPGVIVSSLFFSVLHLQNPNVNFISIVNLFLFGLFTALYALYEGGLWGVFAIHTIWNWAQGNLFGFSVSGLDLQSSILIDLEEAGPDWATGGLFGPEGGVVVTLVLVGGIFGLVYLSRKNARTLPEVTDNNIVE
jgi:membrane protease YdiL (CAAX protease family)